MTSDKPLWKPSEERIKGTNMYRFMNYINERFSKDFKTYDPMWEWSIENIPDFWEAIWDFMNIVHSKKYDKVLVDGDKMPGAKWFVGAELNFAENLLRHAKEDKTAIIFKGEAQDLVHVSYPELYDKVARLAKAMREMGIKKGDRVAGFMPNMPETIMAMLAATSIGAIWSSSSPDFGIKGVLDRFGQIEPKLIFTANGYSYNGKKFSSLEKIADILKDLPSIEKVVVVPYTEENADISGVRNSVHLKDFMSDEKGLKIEFEQVPFDHPLYIMYSSGTTGLPKCMVQSVGGILVHHMKELMLHSDLKPEDRIFYFTTCGWMMWNWLTTSLAVGATIILFDGSPFYPDPGALFTLAEDVKMTHFGTSARYLAAVEKEELKTQGKYDLSELRCMMSTGSPLNEEQFDYVYRDIKEDMCLSSIAGGTDLNGCFALGNPMGAVYRSELQCRGLAMDVRAFNSNGKPVVGEKGELVCMKPFPSMPIYFWRDEDGSKYHSAYFDVYPNIWRHGDFIEITEHNGVIFYGRSDATLNPGGVRIGTSEIYSVVENMGEINDCIVVGQDWKNDVRVILFVKMAEGVELTEELVKKIKTDIKKNATPRHVPSKVIAVDDIPYTINLKKVELAVKKVIHGEEVLNKDALGNPQALDLYKDIKELKED
ncbi:MAG: acetoacetate--CoA ligase [Deltaproteobacteria bacterium]|uniref:Acetoacetate--CoA ligase n=1 Tax=Candidatus Zymogenus saltonus TaxID=2844893 RepID=A0A9D8PRB0_9DELT|nr:acetoacetate--CoA ligase [Candidatus Zymogenus saltonus]